MQFDLGPIYPHLEQTYYYDLLPDGAKWIYEMIKDSYRKGDLEISFVSERDLDSALHALMMDDPCFYLPLEGRVSPTRISYSTGHPAQVKYREMLSELWLSHCAGPIGELSTELIFYSQLIDEITKNTDIILRPIVKAKLLQYISNLMDMRCFIFLDDDNSVITVSDLSETI